MSGNTTRGFPNAFCSAELDKASWRCYSGANGCTSLYFTNAKGADMVACCLDRSREYLEWACMHSTMHVAVSEQRLEVISAFEERGYSYWFTVGARGEALAAADGVALRSAEAIAQ